MKKINVNLKSRSYSIFIKSGLIKKIPSLLDKVNAKRKWLIISQKNLMDSKHPDHVHLLKIIKQILVRPDYNKSVRLHGFDDLF